MSGKPASTGEMVEGREAANRFHAAMKALIAVPKSALPPRKKQEKRKKG